MAPMAALTWTRRDIELAQMRVEALGDAPADLKFFTPQEWKTINVLVDDIIPKDERAGSATDAKVPEFMDFMLSDGGQGNRTTMRAGLAWLDQEATKRVGKGYADVAAADRTKILDDIAWPARAPQPFRANAPPFPAPTGNARATTPVTWFNAVRNLTAGGYFSSRVGYKSLGYTGGVAVPRWTGSSPEIMKKLGLTYDEWDKKYGRGY